MDPLLMRTHRDERALKKYLRSAAIRFESCYRLRCLNRNYTIKSVTDVQSASAGWPFSQESA